MALGLLEDMISFLCPGGWVLHISSDRDDRRIFWGLNFLFRDFLGRKILVGIFQFGYLDRSRDFLGYSKQSEDSW